MRFTIIVLGLAANLACPPGPPVPPLAQHAPEAPYLTARSGHASDGILGGFIYPTATDDLYQVDAALHTAAQNRYFAFTLNVQVEGFREIAMTWAPDAGTRIALTRSDGPCEDGPAMARMLDRATREANRTAPAAWSDAVEAAIDRGEGLLWPSCLRNEPASRFLPALPGGTGTDWAEWDVSVLLPAKAVRTGGTLELRAVNMVDRVESAPTAIRIEPSPLYVAAVGDSVVWGQGLREQDKVYTRLADEVKNRYGSVQLVVVAHSGAMVGAPGRIALANDCTAPPDPRTATAGANGEVPDGGRPFLPCQVRDATTRSCPAQIPDRAPLPDGRRTPRFFCAGGAPDGVTLHPNAIDEGPRFDFVLLNGCINDLGAGDMVRGLRGYDNNGTLDAAVASFCDLRHTLPDLDVFFPRATVAVTAYHRILSQNLDLKPDSCKPPPRVKDIGCPPPPKCLPAPAPCPPPLPCPPPPPDFCTALPGPAGVICGVLETPPRWPRAADRADRFFSQSRAQQTAAVTALAASWRGSGRPIFVGLDGVFPSDTGAFGPRSLIWECSNAPVIGGHPLDNLFRAEDDVRGDRMTHCREQHGGADTLRRGCDRASMFHPNAAGARATADELIHVLDAEHRLPGNRPD